METWGQDSSISDMVHISSRRPSRTAHAVVSPCHEHSSAVARKTSGVGLVPSYQPIPHADCFVLMEVLQLQNPVGLGAKTEAEEWGKRFLWFALLVRYWVHQTLQSVGHFNPRGDVLKTTRVSVTHEKYKIHIKSSIFCRHAQQSRLYWGTGIKSHFPNALHRIGPPLLIGWTISKSLLFLYIPPPKSLQHGTDKVMPLCHCYSVMIFFFFLRALKVFIPNFTTYIRKPIRHIWMVSRQESF